MPERKRCINCWHGRDNDCKLHSSNCATAVFNKVEEPPRWMSVGEGMAEAARYLFSREDKEWLRR